MVRVLVCVCSRVSVRSRSVLPFLVRLKLVIFDVFENPSTVGRSYSFLSPRIFHVVPSLDRVLAFQHCRLSLCLVCYLEGGGGSSPPSLFRDPVFPPHYLTGRPCPLSCQSDFCLSLSVPVLSGCFNFPVNANPQ